MRLWRSASEQIVNRKSKIVNGSWLPDMDLNHDKQIQSLLCYRYTIGQAGASDRLGFSARQSSRETEVPQGQMKIAHGFSRGARPQNDPSPVGAKEGIEIAVLSPLRGSTIFKTQVPRPKPWAIFKRPDGAESFLAPWSYTYSAPDGAMN